MEKFTQKQLKQMVKDGYAIDVTNASDQSAIPESYTQVGYSHGTYGCNGMLFVGRDTAKLYAVTARTTAIFIF